MADVEEIKSRLNVVDVLGEYIRLEKAGSNYRALCPFHNEKSPSFMVNEEKQFWHCFGCQKSGDIFSFVMEMEGMEFREALKILAEKAGVELKSYHPQKTEEKNRTLEILELATKWYEYQLWNGPGKNEILDYLRRRGIKDETIKEFRLGYAPRGWRNILQFLEKRGYKTGEIARTGILVEKKDSQISNSQFQNSQENLSIDSVKCYDRFRDRIMFPIADANGRIVGYSARVAPGGDESQAKYVNTPETEVYHKSKILYGIDKAKREIKHNNFVLLVEGNMDVIACHQAGLKCAVAVSGTALTEDQILIIKRYTDRIKMFFDMDEAGQMATKKSLRLCLEKEMTVRAVSIPEGKDAADLAREDPGRLVSSVANSQEAVEYVFQKTSARYEKNSAEGKKKIIGEMLDVLDSMESQIEGAHWIKRISQEISIPEAALTDALKKANLRNRMEEQSVASGAEIISKSKREVLAEELLGLAAVSKEAWKKLAESNLPFLQTIVDSATVKIIQDGKKYDFSFEELIKNLDDSERDRLNKIYFKKKYRLDINNQPEEIFISNPEAEMEQVVREIRKEAKKEELERITEDLRLAEKRKDNDAVLLLRRQFKATQDELMDL